MFFVIKTYTNLQVYNWHHCGAMPSQSRRTQQKLARRGHVVMIAKKLSSRLKGKQHSERMTSTNKLLPVGSLKRKCVRNLFTGWASTLVGQGRVLTNKLAEQVCRRLRKKIWPGSSQWWWEWNQGFTSPVEAGPKTKTWSCPAHDVVGRSSRDYPHGDEWGRESL